MRLNFVVIKSGLHNMLASLRFMVAFRAIFFLSHISTLRYCWLTMILRSCLSDTAIAGMPLDWPRWWAGVFTIVLARLLSVNDYGKQLAGCLRLYWCYRMSEQSACWRCSAILTLAAFGGRVACQ